MYLIWAKEVVDEVRGVNPQLERMFDRLYRQRPEGYGTLLRSSLTGGEPCRNTTAQRLGCTIHEAQCLSHAFD
jgi:hypothetical protein